MNKPMRTDNRLPDCSLSSAKLLTLTTLFGMVLGFNSQAHGNQGTVGFSGNITTPSCTIEGSGGATGSGFGIVLEMGDISLAELQPASTWVPAHGKTFDLVVTCPGNLAGYRTAHAQFLAAVGSGLDPQDSRLLRLTTGSEARGVAVGIWRPSGTGPLDLSTSPRLDGPFTITPTNGVAIIRVNAILSLTSAATVTGTASALIGFGISYE